MAAAHSGSSLVTSLSSNPPSIHITCGVTCTVLSSNERLFTFIRESSCWTRFERSNRSKGTGSLLDQIFSYAAFSTGNSGCSGIGCPDLSSHLVKESALKVSLSGSKNLSLISACLACFCSSLSKKSVFFLLRLSAFWRLSRVLCSFMW